MMPRLTSQNKRLKDRRLSMKIWGNTGHWKYKGEENFSGKAATKIGEKSCGTDKLEFQIRMRKTANAVGKKQKRKQLGIS